MREIKFRGKRIDNGQWIYGNYFISPLTDENSGCPQGVGWCFLSDGIKRHCIATDYGVVYVVDEKTVGQFTGLLDKNGKEIYEGDICKYPFGDIYSENGCGTDILIGEVSFNLGAFGINGLLLCQMSRIDIEVIGNIYENKNLLK